MRKRTRTSLMAACSVGALIALQGCSKGSDAPPGTQGGAADASSSAALKGGLELPGTKTVYMEATGQGPSREAAIDDALASAVAQVNGKTVTGGEATRARGSVRDFKVLSEKEVERKIAERQDEATVTATDAFKGSIAESAGASAAGAASHGGSASMSTTANYKADADLRRDTTVTLKTGSKGKERIWQVKVGANIDKYDAGIDPGKPRIVIAEPRSPTRQFAIGDGSEEADAVASRILQTITDRVTATNRFVVLDRRFSSEIDTELHTAAGVNAEPTDMVRLGQRLTADIVVVPTIERLEYRRHVRHLKLSGRDLVSYAGGFKGTAAVVNVSTGQLLMTEQFDMEFPTTEARAMGPGIDAQAVVDRAISGLTDKFVTSLVRRTFPVSVVSMSGSNVVLSQGGAALVAGKTYELVGLGEEMIDPQTQRSLGRAESRVGTVKIDRVAPTMSYGTAALTAKTAAFKRGSLQLREEIPSTAPIASPATPTTSSQVAAAARPRKPKDEFDDFLDE